MDYFLLGTRTLKNLYEKPRPIKTWTLKKLDLKHWTLKNVEAEKPGPWEAWTLKNLDTEKPGPRITWFLKNMGNGWMQKKIWRPHYIISLTLEICKEKTFKQAVWKSSYWHFLGTQEMCLKRKISKIV